MSSIRNELWVHIYIYISIYTCISAHIYIYIYMHVNICVLPAEGHLPRHHRADRGVGRGEPQDDGREPSSREPSLCDFQERAQRAFIPLILRAFIQGAFIQRAPHNMPLLRRATAITGMNPRTRFATTTNSTQGRKWHVYRSGTCRAAQFTLRSDCTRHARSQEDAKVPSEFLSGSQPW
jgi:hypothetical protein